jgi:tetratricopeptide (TPR) repeat protein
LFAASEALSKQLQDRFAKVCSQIAKRGTIESSAVTMTTEASAKLHELGYVGGPAGQRPSSLPLHPKGARDPKDMLHVYNQIHDATILIERVQTKKAADILTRIVDAEDPQNKRAMLLLATLIDDAPDLRASIVRVLLKAVNSSDARPDRFVAAQLGLALIEERRYGEAADTFRLALKAEPDDAAIHYHLGRAYEQLKDHEAAVRSYREAIELAQDQSQQPGWLSACRTQLNLLLKQAR